MKNINQLEKCIISRFKMKVWLDDIRPPPKGWVWVTNPQEAIRLLNLGTITDLSLDHDLSLPEPNNGYMVVCWLEKETFINPKFELPKINIHTASPIASIKMKMGILNIRKWYKKKIELTRMSDTNFRIYLGE